VPLAEVVSADLIFVPATRVPGLALAIAVLAVFCVVVGRDHRPVIANCGSWGRLAVPFSFLILEVPELFMLASLRPGSAQLTRR
jgi:hypothetical protein